MKVNQLSVYGALLYGMVASHAYASGFALQEQNVSGMGNAYAGRSAVAEDASTVFFNPAGLTQLAGPQLVVSGILVSPNMEMHVSKATSFVGTTPIQGKTNVNGQDSVTAVPAVYFGGYRYGAWSYGLGINVPFGLETKYSDQSQTRYLATRSEIKTTDINPALAYRVNSEWSVGMGVSAQYLDANLNSALDGGAFSYLSGGSGAPGTLAEDGSAKNRLKDWGWGYNLGVLFEPTHRARLGLSYRSAIAHDLKGNIDVRLPVTVNPAFSLVSQKARAGLRLPETISMSGLEHLSSDWDLMSDISWTRWSTVQKLRLRYSDGLTTKVVDEGFRNTWRLSLGANYLAYPGWVLKTGMAFDESPVVTPHRTSRLPDSNRFWLSLGARYQASKHFVLDLGYSHLFLPKAQLVEKQSPALSLVGHANTYIDLLGMQVTWNVG
jgi:long-chain fatty acid transport protein